MEFTCSSPVCDHWKLDYCAFHETQLMEGCVCKNHSENVKRVAFCDT